MKRVLNVGSINVDHVYRVDHFVVPGETIGCDGYTRFAGGKGLNQSIALAHAQADVYHSGRIGNEDEWLKTLLSGHGVNTELVEGIDGASGHAVIQVDSNGENAIVIFGGANQTFDETAIEAAFSRFGEGDYLLLQNEVNAIADLVRKGKEQGMSVVLNPAPMSPAVLDYPLELVDILIVNETEGQALTGKDADDDIISELRHRFPATAIVLTLGSRGVRYCDGDQDLTRESQKVEVVDTTAAGDTFIGFFLATLLKTDSVADSLAMGCKAAGVSVTRNGASDSIPLLTEL